MKRLFSCVSLGINFESKDGAVDCNNSEGAVENERSESYWEKG